MKTLIIDGNNLIHKAVSLKKQFSKDKTASQRILIETLRGKLSQFKTVIIVFDGYGNFTEKNVFFSENKTADEIIKSRIENFKNPKLLRVISSDIEIMSFSKKCSCEVMKSEDFWKDINKIKPESKEKNINQYYDYDKPANMSKKEIDYFRKAFS